MLIPSKQQAAPMPWDVNIMEDGNRQVFGIHIGTTNYREAQLILRQYGKTAIFTEDNKEPSVEAYFNSINLGGLSGKLVLNLSVDEQQINELLADSLDARVQPSGAHLYTLNSSEKLINSTVSGLTYIPSIKLDADKIRYRFGEPSSITNDEENPSTEIWNYIDLGLIIRLTPKEKTILQYSEK
ncbi:MAG: lytic murein transglycosylase [Gammaproteobacteria bacterium]|nr:MAG: lytic murein transglycosylase [Gammaproteobacteria bacterium]